MRDLSKRLRGGNFRRAVEAVAALRHLAPARSASLVPSIDTKDEQRFVRIWSKPTGLLDLKRLEEAIERIRRREG